MTAIDDALNVKDGDIYWKNTCNLLTIDVTVRHKRVLVSTFIYIYIDMIVETLGRELYKLVMDRTGVHNLISCLAAMKLYKKCLFNLMRFNL